MPERREQHRLNFKPLPQGHGSLRRMDGLEFNARLSGCAFWLSLNALANSFNRFVRRFFSANDLSMSSSIA